MQHTQHQTPLKGLIYISQAIEHFDHDSIEALTAKAIEKNNILGITGYLFFNKNTFLQYIEGEPSQLNLLINSIKQDKRHQVIKIIDHDALEHRKFPTWSMEHLTSSKLIQIKMEHLIIQQVEHIKTLEHITKEVSSEYQSIWRMVNKLSEKHQLLTV